MPDVLIYECDKSYGDVMELADVPDSKSGGGNTVWVRLPPSPPNRKAAKMV
jgi:hypothetical protein